MQYNNECLAHIQFKAVIGHIQQQINQCWWFHENTSNKICITIPFWWSLYLKVNFWALRNVYNTHAPDTQRHQALGLLCCPGHWRGTTILPATYTSRMLRSSPANHKHARGQTSASVEAATAGLLSYGKQANESKTVGTHPNSRTSRAEPERK